MVQKANTIWRDFNTDGVPSSLASDPDKVEIRKWGTWVEVQLAAAGIGAKAFLTLDDLNADLDYDEGSIAWVVTDATTANNGQYRKSGASGAGLWTKFAELDDDTIANEVIAARGGKASLDARLDAGDDQIDVALAKTAIERPGDAFSQLTSDLTGASKDAAAMAFGSVVVNADGAVLRVPHADGPEPQIVARRDDFGIEPGAIYSARWAYRRASDTSDPAGDAVEAVIQWLDKDKAPISQTVVHSGSLAVSGGLRQVSTTFSLDQTADITAPSAARYMRPFVRVYGATGSTDIVVVDRQRSSGEAGAQGPAGDLTQDAQDLYDQMLGLLANFGMIQNIDDAAFGGVGDDATDNADALAAAVATGRLTFLPAGKVYRTSVQPDFRYFWGFGSLADMSGTHYADGPIMPFLSIQGSAGGATTLPITTANAFTLLELRNHEDGVDQCFNILHRRDPEASGAKSVGVFHIYGLTSKGLQVDLVTNQAAFEAKQARNPNIAPELGDNYVGSGGGFQMTRAGDGSEDPVKKWTRNLALFGNTQGDIVMDGRIDGGDGYAREWSGTQNGNAGTGPRKITFQSCEGIIEVVGCDNLYLNARAQVRAQTGIALVAYATGTAATVPVGSRPPATVPIIFRNSDDGSRPYWFDPSSNTQAPLDSQAGRLLDVSFSGSITTTGNQEKIVGWNAATTDDFGGDAWDGTAGEWTAPRDMTVSIFALANMSGSPTQEAVRILKNGVTMITLGSATLIPSGPYFLKLAAGDVVALAGYSSSGAGQTITAGQLMIAQISP